MTPKRGRAKAVVYPPPTPEETAHRAAFEKAVDAGHAMAEALFRPQIELYSQQFTVWDISRKEYCIPGFQRGYVWTPEQAIAMMRRLFLGMPLGQIMVWEQKYPEPPMLMDGQQRLVTLGAKVFRNGEPVTGHTVYVDYTKRKIDGLLSCEPGPNRVNLSQLCNFWKIPGFDKLDPETQGFIGNLSDCVSRIKIVATVISRWTRDSCTYEQAAQIFRCYNSGGTPINESELPPEVTE